MSKGDICFEKDITPVLMYTKRFRVCTIPKLIKFKFRVTYIEHFFRLVKYVCAVIAVVDLLDIEHHVVFALF